MAGHRRRPAAGDSTIRVPGSPGLKQLRIHKGMPCSMIGAMVRGCRTSAPKRASRVASSYESSRSTWALGTTFGSAVRIPSTSVQIRSSVASRQAAMTAAEKSLPLRPSVVGAPSSVAPTYPVMTGTTPSSTSGRTRSLIRFRVAPICGDAAPKWSSVTIKSVALIDCALTPRQRSAATAIAAESCSPKHATASCPRAVSSPRTEMLLRNRPR